MKKVGRNSPCPCGSGKKYKRCCLDKEKKIDLNITPVTKTDKLSNIAILDHSNNIENLDEWSNNSIELIREGKLKKAEALTVKLLEEFSELHDGWERMAMIYEIPMS